MDAWLELTARTTQPSSVATYARHLLGLVRWLARQGVTLTGQISPESLRAYGAAMTERERARTWKASTVNNHLNPVRQFLRWAVAESLVFDRSPEGEPWVTEGRVDQWLSDVQDTSRPTRKERALTAAEAGALLAAIDAPRDRALFALMLGSGLRVSEACALRPGDIELRPDGAAVIHVMQPKGGAAKRRRVVIHARVLAVVRAWARDAGLRLGDPTDTRPLWPSARQPARGISRIQVYQLLAGYAKRAGLGRTISPHNLRHSFGTQFYRERRDPVAVAEALGHSGLDYVQTYVKSVDASEAAPFEPEW